MDTKKELCILHLKNIVLEINNFRDSYVLLSVARSAKTKNAIAIARLIIRVYENHWRGIPIDATSTVRKKCYKFTSLFFII